MKAYDEFVHKMHKLISKSDSYSKEELHDELTKFYSRFKYYEDLALNGRDSDDTRGLFLCTDNPVEWVEHDLGM